MAVKLYVDLSGMVNECAGNLDLLLIIGFMTSNFMCLSFSTLRFTILWLFEKVVWRPISLD